MVSLELDALHRHAAEQMAVGSDAESWGKISAILVDLDDNLNELYWAEIAAESFADQSSPRDWQGVRRNIYMSSASREYLNDSLSECQEEADEYQARIDELGTQLEAAIAEFPAAKKWMAEHEQNNCVCS